MKNTYLVHVSLNDLYRCTNAHDLLILLEEYEQYNKLNTIENSILLNKLR